MINHCKYPDNQLYGCSTITFFVPFQFHHYILIHSLFPFIIVIFSSFFLLLFSCWQIINSFSFSYSNSWGLEEFAFDCSTRLPDWPSRPLQRWIAPFYSIYTFCKSIVQNDYLNIDFHIWLSLTRKRLNAQLSCFTYLSNHWVTVLT